MGRVVNRLCGLYLSTGHTRKKIQELMLGLDSMCCEAPTYSQSYSRGAIISDLVRYAFSESIFSMAGVAQLGEQQTEA